MSAPFCLTAAGLRSRADLAADVARARRALAAHDAVCNIAAGRYDFAVALAAALLDGRTTVLPPSRAERAVEAAVAGFAAPLMFEGLEQLTDAGAAPAPGPEALDAALARAPGAVHVFTSGSTGQPVRHVKRWAALAGGARLTDELVARAGLTRGRAMLAGTTPHQHMYGLEASLFAGLAQGHLLHDAPLFYPADIEALEARAAAAGIEDIVLVTSPPHLRFLAEAVGRAPRIRAVISATAPLGRDLAERLEAGGARRVFEIYGCTEVGSLAWRRTAAGELWQPMAGFTLARRAEGWFADAPHLAAGAVLADELELQAGGRFRLMGRIGDMVRIAGKRQSLGALNAALAAMPGLLDGVVVRETVDGEDRLGVIVVLDAPGGEDRAAFRARLRAHMLAHVDPVFVPRRVTFVDRLPRGATGKIPAEALARLAAGAEG